ncbi:ABC transporter substrate-binding protein [Lacibacterium aquatile]|uniref:ABC transporter substrate-binding protein n=1 Tax=Lacibacterium aquatile TaxID=1168082 RepID=A0ABW5DQT5_9PROT
MGFMMNRRSALATLGGSALAMGFGGSVFAQGAKTLNILSHKVHQNSLTTGKAGDLTEAWRGANGATVNWSTFDIGPLQDRLFREASLGQSDFDIGFLLNGRAVPAVADLFEPLTPYQAKLPVEDFGDFAPGLVKAMTMKGNLFAVPFRHATNGLFYNEEYLTAKGVSVPRSLEELVEAAKMLTFKREDGAPVIGCVLSGTLAYIPVMFARAYGGDFITEDYQVIPNKDAVVKALTTLRELMEAGALPRNFAATSNDDQVTWMQQGRAAFTMLPFSRWAQLNNAEQSRFPGKIQATELPVSSTLGDKPMAAAVEFWSMAVLKNSKNKELAWNFIQAMSSKANTLGAARNGNGPVRVSTYKDPALTAAVPTTETESRALSNARATYPAFAEASRAEAIFVEETQAAVLGRKSAKEAVDSTIERVKPLVAAR